MADVPTLLRQLQALSLTDWKTVQAKMEAYNSLGAPTYSPYLKNPTKSSPSDSQDYLLEGMRFELKRRGLTSWRMPPQGSFQAASVAVRKQLEKQLGGSQLTASEKISIGRMAGLALATLLEQWRVPVTAHSMFKHVNKTLDALDAAFPGYLKADVLSGFIWHRENI